MTTFKPTTACTEWTGTVHRDTGYGRKWRGGRSGGEVLAHRLTWEEANGAIPPGMMVLHRCDNPPCVNVDHLYLGTHADNMRDRDSRDRQARGERNSQARLTEQQVVEIRRLYGAGNVMQTTLASQFGVTVQTIHSIVRRKSWRYLP